MNVYVPLAVCIIGGVIYLVTTGAPKVEGLAKDMFWTGLLVTLLTHAGSAVR